MLCIPFGAVAIGDRNACFVLPRTKDRAVEWWMVGHDPRSGNTGIAIRHFVGFINILWWCCCVLRGEDQRAVRNGPGQDTT